MNTGLRRWLGTGVLALGLTTATLARAQQPAPAPPAPANTEKPKSDSSSSLSSQNSGQGSTQGQAQDPPKDDSVAAAAKKVKTKKGKAEPGKVYSEDDLDRLPEGGVSVIGQKPKPVDNAGKVKGAESKTDAGKGDQADATEVKDEFYWRKRARKILDQLEAVDLLVEQARDAAKRPQPSKKDSERDDPNAAATETNDPKSVLQQLEKQKADLEKQLDALQDEGRRAGAPAEWFR